MKAVIKSRLTLTVTYDTDEFQGTARDAERLIVSLLGELVDHASNRGLLTRDTGLTVEAMEHEIHLPPAGGSLLG
jgi:hypothetical protein